MESNSCNFTQGVVLIVIVVLGVAGNVTSLITWTKGRRCNRFPGSIYLRILALSDALVLCFPATQFAILMTFETELKHVSAITCKLFDAVGHFCALVSTWVIVSVTVQRTIAVCSPFKSSRWNSKRREIVVLFVFIMIFLCLNIPYGLAFKLILGKLETQTLPNRTYSTTSTLLVVAENSSGVNPHLYPTNGSTAFPDTVTDMTTDVTTLQWTCVDDPDSFLPKYHKWIVDVTLLYVAPFSFLIICNSILLIKVFRRHDALGPRDSVTQKRHGKDIGFASMSARVVSISITHCVLVGPVAITGLVPGFPVSTYIMLHVLYFLNHGVNFIFYSFIGTAFRRDLSELVCIRRMDKAIDISSTTATGH